MMFVAGLAVGFLGGGFFVLYLVIRTAEDEWKGGL